MTRGELIYIAVAAFFSIVGLVSIIVWGVTA